MIKNMKDFIKKIDEDCVKFNYISGVVKSWYKDLAQASTDWIIERTFNQFYGFLWAFYAVGEITEEEKNILCEEIFSIKMKSIENIHAGNRTAEPEKEIPEPEKKETALEDKKPELENKVVETIDDLIIRLREKNDKYLIFISDLLDTWYTDLGTSLSELDINCAFHSINAAFLTLYGMHVITKEQRKALYSEISEVRQNSLRFASDMAIKKCLDMFDAELELDL